MSAIFGLFNLNNQPVSKTDLERMRVALASHGSDGGGIWTQGPVGLGQRLMRFTPQDQFERQPLVSADEQRVLVSDGRIDNRKELISELRFQISDFRSTPFKSEISNLKSEIPDSALILRVYEKWGTDCVHHLVGAYTFALWDARAQRLMLVRCAVAGPPLFYYSTPHAFAFATMPKGLFALPFVSRELDEQYLADYLTMTSTDKSASFYRGIKHLLPGHMLIVSRDEFRVSQYWQVDLKREIYFPRDEDYVQAFDELFDRVIGDHLKSLTPVGVLMSGGLDSTSIAATAARLLKPEGKRLATFTEVPRPGFDGAIIPGRYPDETTFAQAMARRYDNLALNLIRTDGRVYLDDLDSFFDAAEVPFRNSSNRVWYEEILQQAQRQGIRVVITGLQGNLTISWTGSGVLPQLVRALKWRRALREARALAQHGNARSTWRALVGQGLMPLLPTPLWLAIERARHRDDAILDAKPPWRAYSPINPVFAAELQLEERARARGHNFNFRTTLDTRLQRFEIIARTAATGDAMDAGYQAIFAVDQRHPLGDARLVEFCLRIPEDQYLRNGQSRWLIRRTMGERLPHEILANKQRGLQAADWFERLCGAQSQIMADLTRMEQSELARRALDLPRLRQLAEKMPHPEGTAEQQLMDYRAVMEFGLMTGRFLCWFEKNG